MKRPFAFLNLILIALVCGLLIYIVMGTHLLARFASAGGERTMTEVKNSDLKQIGVIQDSRLIEISGIDASYRYPGCFWVHNDSGNAPELFLISKSGETLAVVRLDGARNVDWEDICLFDFFGVPHICVADVGDNAARRQSCQLYMLPEPELQLPTKSQEAIYQTIAKSDFKQLDFQYPDGPRNCEAIAVHPKHRDFYLIQKSANRNPTEKSFGIYKLRLKKNFELLSSTARRVGEVGDRMVTGAAISRDNDELVFCNYVSASRLKRKPVLSWEQQIQSGDFKKIILPVQRQGEAICFTPDGQSLVVVSEKRKQPIWQIKIRP